MARTHHRKKHKQHLKQFRHDHEAGASVSSSRNKVSGTWMFLIAGLVLGFAIGYFASGSMVWAAAGTAVGGLLGFWLGKRIDSERYH